MKECLVPLWSLMMAFLCLTAGFGSRADTLVFNIPQPIPIPGAGKTTNTFSSPSAPAIDSLTSIKLILAHEWLGDLTVTLVPPNGAPVVIFDRVGVSSGDPNGSSAVLGEFVPSSDENNPGFTLTPQPYQFALAGASLAAAAQAAVDNGSLVLPPNTTYASQSWVTGSIPTGIWRLEVVDNADLSGGSLAGVELSYERPGSTSHVVLAWNQPADITYGTPLGPAQLSATATVDGASVSGVFSYSPSGGTVLPAGKDQVLSVVFTPNAGTGLSPASGAVKINVRPTSLTATADPKSAVYGASLPALTVSYSGFVNGDTAAVLTSPATASTTANSRSPVGSYPISVSGGASPNYTVTPRNGVLTITPASLIARADDLGNVYGAPVPSLTVSYAGFVNGDTATSLSQAPTLSTLATSRSPAGLYPINITGGASANYTLDLRRGTLTVTKAPLVVTADDKAMAVGGSVPTLTATFRGFVNGETVANLSQAISLTTSASVSSAAGTYPIIVSGGASPNYELTRVNGTLTIGKQVLTISADPKTIAYGQPMPALTASFVGFVNGDTAAGLTEPVILSTTATPQSPPGLYPITISGGAHPNYSVVLNNSTLTVTKASLNVTAENKTRLYGAANPDFTVTYSGFVNGDTVAVLQSPVSFSTTATTRSPAGIYPITVTGGFSPNYNLVLNNGTLTVEKALLTVTADNKTKMYGASMPLLTATYSGFLKGDSVTNLSQAVTLTTAALPNSAVGTYPIRLNGGSSSNYTFTLREGTLTVTQAVLTVTAESKLMVYGSPLPNLTATYSGFAKGDSVVGLQPPVLTTTATPQSPVGTYPITLSGGSSPNYQLVLKDSTLTIRRAPLSITADNREKVYGAALPVFTATYDGFVNGDTVGSLTQPIALVTTATAASPVGTYQITVTGGASPNYTLLLNNGMLSVTPAPLTITADSKSKLLGAPLPSLTATYVGFVNGDTASRLLQPVRLTTTATGKSPLGTYPIVVDGAQSGNYAISFVNGTLSVVAGVVDVELHAGSLTVAPNGIVQVRVGASSGARVRLEGSSDLRTWKEVGTQTAAASYLLFEVGTTEAGPLRFFRAIGSR